MKAMFFLQVGDSWFAMKNITMKIVHSFLALLLLWQGDLSSVKKTLIIGMHICQLGSSFGSSSSNVSGKRPNK